MQLEQRGRSDARPDRVAELVDRWAEDGEKLLPGVESLQAYLVRQLPDGVEVRPQSGGTRPDLVVDGDIGVTLVDRYEANDLGRQLGALTDSVSHFVVCADDLPTEKVSTWNYLKRSYTPERLGVDSLSFVGSFR